MINYNANTDGFSPKGVLQGFSRPSVTTDSRGARLTYRDVEKASYQIAVNRGRPAFILHISRLADIENRGVVPSLHKLYSRAAILHLDPAEISGWYDAPFRRTFSEGASIPPPCTSLSSFPVPPVFAHGADGVGSETTELLTRRPATVVPMPQMDGLAANSKHRYGYCWIIR